MGRPSWDNQFREAEGERNARLRAKRLKRQRETPKATEESVASRLLDARLERAMGGRVDDDLADMLD